MGDGGRIGSVTRDRANWPVLLSLVLVVVVPAACIIWFMTEAAGNQADAARQRLSEALRGQLRLLRDRIEADSSQPTYIHTIRDVGYRFEPGD